MKKARKRKLIKEIEHVLDNYSFLGYGDEIEVVWRREDGYVGCTAYDPNTMGCEKFVILLVTPDWPEALEILPTLRGVVHHQLVASWDEYNRNKGKEDAPDE